MAVWEKYPGQLRADLQRFYGIDLDKAEEHTAGHIATLVEYLPSDSNVIKAELGKDGEWSLNDVLLAEIRNIFALFVYGMGAPGKRGPKPALIGPSWMTDQKRTLEARAMTISDLMEELSKPRG